MVTLKSICGLDSGIFCETVGFDYRSENEITGDRWLLPQLYTTVQTF